MLRGDIFLKLGSHPLIAGTMRAHLASICCCGRLNSVVFFCKYGDCASTAIAPNTSNKIHSILNGHGHKKQRCPYIFQKERKNTAVFGSAKQDEGSLLLCELLTHREILYINNSTSYWRRRGTMTTVSRDPLRYRFFTLVDFFKSGDNQNRLPLTNLAMMRC